MSKLKKNHYQLSLLLKTLTIMSVVASLIGLSTGLLAPCLSDELKQPADKLKTALVMPVHKQLTVKTTQGTVICNPGSLVFFIDTLRDVAYYNVNSQHRGDVKVLVGKLEIKLLPGEELLVTQDTSAEFEKVNPGKGISIRKPKLEHEGDGLRIFTADFSIPSAVMAIKPLKAMLKSSDKYQRNLINEVLKNAVIWTETTAVDGSFVPAK